MKRFSLFMVREEAGPGVWLHSFCCYEIVFSAEEILSDIGERECTRGSRCGFLLLLQWSSPLY